MDPQAAHRIAKLDEVLRQVPYQYQNRARLRSDVAQLLQSCKTLQPQTNTFSGSGKTVTLFYLYGVVPISYHGNTYNIPVTIYFDPPYPKQPPRCFVTPTNGMALKPNHSHVDSGGMVYVQYLASWSENASTLPQLISAMTSCFSSVPPVYSTTTAQRPTQEQQAAQPQGPVTGVLNFLGLGGGGGQAAAATAAAQAAAATPVVAAVPVAKAQAQPVATVIATTVRPKEDLTKTLTTTLKERWPVLVDPMTKDLKDQLQRKKELEEAQKKLEKEEKRLSEGTIQARMQIEKLRATEADLDRVIEAESGREAVDPEAMLECLDPDRRQVLDYLSEEMAFEELLSALDELLAERKISLDDFMREVRDVSRQQFMCKIKRQKAIKAVTGVEAPSAPPAPLEVPRTAVPAVPA